MNYSLNETIEEYEPSKYLHTIDLDLFYKVEYYLEIIIHCVGLVGNLLMLVVYYNGTLRKMSISVYFRCVAVLCVIQNVYELTRYFLPTNRVENETDILCRLGNFFYFF